MNTKKDVLPKSRIKFTIELTKEETETYFDKAYEKLAPTVELKGFRAGQAPKLLIIEHIGYGRYNQEALDLALSESYYNALKKEKIIPIQPPAVAVKKFSEKESLVYEAEVDVIPEIKLGDYKKIKVKKNDKEHKVSSEEIEKIITKLRFQNAIFNKVERSCKEGDRIEINFDGYVDKIKQENLSSKNHPLILGEGALIPGFEKELTGMKKDDEREFDLDVPATKDKTKFKKTHFKVKITDVSETILPEVDGEFAKKFGHDSAEALKEAIGKSVLDEKIKADRDNLEKEVLEKVVTESKIDLPESLIEQEISRRILGFQKQMGPGFEKYLESINKKIEDIKKDLRPSAEVSVKTGLVLGEIARAEGFLKDEVKDENKEKEVIRKSIDFLIENATK